jgi:hypothetical protein
MEYREAREFAAAVFPDKDLMTYRNGKRALTRLLMDVDRLDRLNYTRNDDDQEARGVVEDTGSNSAAPREGVLDSGCREPATRDQS